MKCINVKLGADLMNDLRRRIKVYPSDFVDGFRGPKTLAKVLATTVFLYFSILLPTIAFSSLNTTQTNGQIGGLYDNSTIEQYDKNLFIKID